MKRFAHRERPSDRERRQHYAERQARENTRPHGCGVHPLPTTRGARVQPDAATTTTQESALMAATHIIPIPWTEDRDVVSQVLRHGVQEGDLDTPMKCVAFVAEPEAYEWIYTSWRAWMALEEGLDQRIAALKDRAA